MTRRFEISAFLFLLCLLWPDRGAAQSGVRFECKVEPQKVEEGGMVEVIFSLSNANAAHFQAPDFKGFSLLSGPSRMMGETNINGRRFSHVDWVYELEAEKVGTFVIGPAEALVQGRIIRSAPAKVQVVPAQNFKNTTTADKADLFLRAETDVQQAYVGQQVHYRVVLYTRVSVLDFDWMDLPQTDNGYAVELKRFDTRSREETVGGKRYMAQTLFEMAVYPQTPGTLTIDEAHIVAEIEQPGALGRIIPAKIPLSIDSIRLDVRSLPTPMPDNCIRIPGKLEWEVRIDKTALLTEDAATVSITIRHNGDPKRFQAPVLKAPDGLEAYPPRLNSEETYEIDGIRLHSATYDYVLLAHKAGTYDIRPALVYFNTDSNRYVTQAWPEALRISVSPNPNPAAPPVDTGSNIPPPKSPPVFPRLALLAAGLLLLLGGLAWRRRRRQDPKASPAPEPIEIPTDALREQIFRLGKEPISAVPDFYAQLYRALQAFLSRRLALPTAEWSGEALRARLAHAGLSESDAQTLLEVIQRCERVLYGAQAPAQDPKSDWVIVERILRRL